jgi:ribonuclease HII
MSESRGVRKVTKQDSLAKVLARVFGTIAIFHVSKFMGLLFVIVRLANSKKVTERERVKLISEIQREIEIIDSQLNDGSIESTEAKRNLQRTRSALEEALRKIQSNKGKYMTDEAKNAVNDIVSRRR